ncbi:hypothetical protein G7Y79_00028g062420 [Physcia stellaris]|nr:hypothetical protein G7Y79_00028g062420 [Physcia stellaris]
MLPTSLLNLLAVCLLSHRTPSVVALHTALNPEQALQLLSRQNNQCATPNYSSCNKPGLPGNFCCASNQQCIAFNNNKSAICCPSGKDCKTIEPVTCDISKQDAGKFPASGLHTTDLTGSLEKCGSNCCPKGYSCETNHCAMQSSSSTSKASSTTTPTSTGSATKSTTSTSASTSSTHTALPGSLNPHCNKFPGLAVGIGVAVGFIIGIITVIAAILILGRHRKNHPPGKSNASVYSSAGQPSISDPMPQYPQNGELRNDFLRRGPEPTSPNAAAYGRPRASSRVRSLFNRSPRSPNFQKSPGHGGHLAPLDNIGRTLQTPMQTPNRNALRREPSTESIKIYSPPNAGYLRDNASQRPGTTFSGMIREADLPPNLTFLGSPGRAPDPRSRGGDR